MAFALQMKRKSSFEFTKKENCAKKRGQFILHSSLSAYMIILLMMQMHLSFMWIILIDFLMAFFFILQLHHCIIPDQDTLLQDRQCGSVNSVILSGRRPIGLFCSWLIILFVAIFLRANTKESAGWDPSHLCRWYLWLEMHIRKTFPWETYTVKCIKAIGWHPIQVISRPSAHCCLGWAPGPPYVGQLTGRWMVIIYTHHLKGVSRFVKIQANFQFCDSLHKHGCATFHNLTYSVGW